jgi:phosphoglycerate dehydrogenase-like enzyme
VELSTLRTTNSPIDRIKVIVASSFNETQLDRLRSVSPRLHVTLRQKEPWSWSRSDTSDLFEGDEEIFYGFMPPRDLAKAPRLRWVQLHSAGIDHLKDHPLMRSNVLMTTTSGIHAVPIGEFAIMMMLTLSRHVPHIVRLQTQAHWPKREERFTGNELRGKNLGVIGYGSIGREAARIAKQGFNMRILAMTRSGRKEDGGYVERNVGDPKGELPDAWYNPQELMQMLSQSDYVLTTTPLTDETRNLIGEKELRAMKSSAYIVNVARGEIINENALVNALKERWIAGAGLDVFATEPLPASSPLWKLDNALIAPHVSGASPRYNDRATDLFAENLKRYLTGEQLLNMVDRSTKY